MKKTGQRDPASKGFTLVEAAIVLMIGGLIIAAVSAAFQSHLKQAKISTTRARMEAIDKSIQQYLMINGKYPCAASLEAAPETADFGREVSVTCNAAAAGTMRATGRDSAMVRIGAVPNRTLNLPDQMMFDGWNNRILYAVTERQANQSTPFAHNNGAISVVDSAGFSVLGSDGEGHYVLVSHGPDGTGAYTVAGNEVTPCPAGPGPMDQENCNGDATFRRTLMTSTADATRFDDILVARAQSSPDAVDVAIPAGAIVAFDSLTCPPAGWAPVLGMEGRTIVGVGDYTETSSDATRPTWNNNHSYALAGDGGWAWMALSMEEMPPHNHNIATITASPSTPATGIVYGNSMANHHANIAAVQTAITGGDGAAPMTNTEFDNRMPYRAYRYCRKL